jgi:O-antigen ligase
MENQAAMDRIERNPVFGVGLGGQYKQTASSEGHFGIEGTYIHNGYLFFPLKMGLVATFIPLAFMIAFALTLRQGVQRHRADPDNGLVAALAGAFAVPCVASYTQPEWADPRGIAAFAIFTGLALLFRRFGAVRPASADKAAPAAP